MWKMFVILSCKLANKLSKLTGHEANNQNGRNDIVLGSIYELKFELLIWEGT